MFPYLIIKNMLFFINRLPITFKADTGATISRYRAEGEGFEPPKPDGLPR